MIGFPIRAQKPVLSDSSQWIKRIGKGSVVALTDYSQRLSVRQVSDVNRNTAELFRSGWLHTGDIAAWTNAAIGTDEGGHSRR